MRKNPEPIPEGQALGQIGGNGGFPGGLGSLAQESPATQQKGSKKQY